MRPPPLGFILSPSATFRVAGLAPSLLGPVLADGERMNPHLSPTLTAVRLALSSPSLSRGPAGGRTRSTTIRAIRALTARLTLRTIRALTARLTLRTIRALTARLTLRTIRALTAKLMLRAIRKISASRQVKRFESDTDRCGSVRVVAGQCGSLRVNAGQCKAIQSDVKHSRSVSFPVGNIFSVLLPLWLVEFSMLRVIETEMPPRCRTAGRHRFEIPDGKSGVSL